MAVSTVKLNGTTLMTVNDTTATEADVINKYFYKADGTKVLGTASGGGGGGSADDDVVFIDYDGTVLHSYSASDFQALTAMPSNPSHTGLTAQGWNWSLADAKAYLTNHSDAKVTIGQMYTTDDGKTRIYIHLSDERKSPMLGLAVNGTVDVDWGDGTAHDTLIGTTLGATEWTSNHEYATGGDYVIKLTVVSGAATINGDSSTNRYGKILRHSSSADGRNNYYLSAISRVEIGNNINLGPYAFERCRSLEYLIIPSTEEITAIPIYFADYCDSLKTIIIPNSVISVGTTSFRNDFSVRYLSLPSNLHDISASAFFGLYGVTSIAIPDTMTSAPNEAFRNMYGVASFTIPANSTTIWEYFAGSHYCLRNIKLPSTITSIGTYAFYNCYSLKELDIPSGVTSIGSYAFYGCSALNELNLPTGITSIGNYTFYNCFSLAELNIPSGVTSIGNYAFGYCSSLTELDIPSGVTSIGSSAFSGCYSLTELDIPSGVTNINSSTFYNCFSLAKLIIPNGVTDIGANAFQNCYGMAEYHFLSTTPPTLANANAFSGIPADCKIYVQYSADHSILEAYQTATNWSTYASYMVEEEL